MVGRYNHPNFKRRNEDKKRNASQEKRIMWNQISYHINNIYDPFSITNLDVMDFFYIF